MTRGLLAVAFACAAQAALADDCRKLDAARGTVSFELKQAGAPFRGAFRRFGGELCLDAGRVTRIDVWLEPASVDAGLPEIDKALQDKDFFAVAQFPRALYSARSVEQKGNLQLAHGTLQMKGRSRPLDVPFDLKRDGAQQVVSGALALKRLDYGIGTGEWANTQWLGDEVTLTFRVAIP